MIGERECDWAWGAESFQDVGEFVKTACLRDAENRPTCHLCHACYRS